MSVKPYVTTVAVRLSGHWGFCTAEVIEFDICTLCYVSATANVVRDIKSSLASKEAAGLGRAILLMRRELVAGLCTGLGGLVLLDMGRAQALEPLAGSPPDSFAAHIRTEVDRWATIVGNSDAEPE